MKLIAGVDEAGRGPLAGPVVAAAAVFAERYSHPEIKDSKQLSAKIRERLFEEIKNQALAWSVVAVGHKRIEKLNIREASRLAMSLALERAARQAKVDLVLVDGNMPIDTSLPQRTVIKGDAKHIQISAASILAKVWRDRLMKRLDQKYPGYGFARHSGYPTSSHRRAIARLGPCAVHRINFRGVKEFVPLPDHTAEHQEMAEKAASSHPPFRALQETSP